MKIPEDCLQSIEPWWTEDDGKTLCRGRLILANLPFVMSEQATLKVTGRNNPTEHTTALYEISSPFRMNEVREASKLPVAGLPKFHNEVYLVQRAKIRPAIVLNIELPEIPKKLRQKETKRWTQPTAIVAPAYGASPKGRSAPNPELLKRFYRCEYPNYLCLWLPKQRRNKGIQLNNDPSIIRLDQMQPIGKGHHNYQRTRYRLNDYALQLLDDWMLWLYSGELPDGELDDIREIFLDN